MNGRYRQLYDKQYRFERDRFINPGEDFTPEPPKARAPARPAAHPRGRSNTGERREARSQARGGRREARGERGPGERRGGWRRRASRRSCTETGAPPGRESPLGDHAGRHRVPSCWGPRCSACCRHIVSTVPGPPCRQRGWRVGGAGGLAPAAEPRDRADAVLGWRACAVSRWRRRPCPSRARTSRRRRWAPSHHAAPFGPLGDKPARDPWAARAHRRDAILSAASGCPRRNPASMVYTEVDGEELAMDVYTPPDLRPRRPLRRASS